MKIIVSANVFTIASDKSLETLNKVKKFRPSALCLYKGEGNDKTIDFMLTTGTTGSVSEYGICFADEAKTGDKVAVFTQTIPASVKADAAAVKDYIKEAVGLAVVKGNAVEAQVDAALESITADETAIEAGITFAAQ